MLVQSIISGRTAVKIAGSVEAALASGAASAGDLLPSVRGLARHLKVSAATVAAAYRLLQERGVVTAERRRGTRIRPAALEPALRDAKALIVTPRAQNPTGAAITPHRARALRAMLRKHEELLLIEDDHAGPVAGASYVTLVEPSRARWAVVRSVSK